MASLKVFLAVALAFFTPCVWTLEASTDKSVEHLEQESSSMEEKRAVTQVITLLQDMLKTLNKEGKEDQEAYDKMACWCETNEKIKTKAIADAEVKIADLASKIEEYTATITTLKTEIRRTEEVIAEDQKALATATSLREKQLAEFNALEKDLVTSIGALKAAIVVLEKHSLSFAQMDRSHIRVVASNLQKVMSKHAPLLKNVITPSERKVLTSLLQIVQPDGATSTHASLVQTSGPYDHQSGTIFGIISQMKESFETNLAAAQKDELENSKNFQEVKEAQEAQIAAGKAKRFTKRQLLATTEEKLADAKTEKKLTEETKYADEQFLASLKKKCKAADDEYLQRQKTRMEETQAVTEAVSILGTDEAHDLFSKALKASFLQKQAISNAKQRKQQLKRRKKKGGEEERDEASSLLTDLAQRVHNPRLATLAVRVKLDAFTQIKKDIAEMITQLQAQQADEIKLKDSCKTMLNENAAKIEAKTRDKIATEQEMSDLEAQIATLDTLLKQLDAEIKDLQEQRLIAGNTRNYEHADFFHSVDEQRAARDLLKAAIKVLSKFYVKSTAKFVGVQQEAHRQAPPPDFKEYKDQSGGITAIDMLKKIIEDAVKIENEALVAESDAQRAYEDFVKETNLAIDARRANFEESKQAKADKEVDLQNAKEENAGQLAELESLGNQKTDLKAQCDYVVTNFALRQKSRNEEIESLKQASQILSGAQTFLQKKKSH